MKLTYKNNKLQNLCENSRSNKELVKKFGIDVAKKLPQRIQQLKAFESLADVPSTLPFRRHKLQGDRKGLFAVNINEVYRIIFRSVMNNIEVDNLKEIKDIEITEVSNHYG